MVERIYRWWKLRRLKASGNVFVIEFEYLTLWNADFTTLCFAFGHKSYRLMTDAELLDHA